MRFSARYFLNILGQNAVFIEDKVCFVRFHQDCVGRKRNFKGRNLKNVRQNCSNNVLFNQKQAVGYIQPSFLTENRSEKS